MGCLFVNESEIFGVSSTGCERSLRGFREGFHTPWRAPRGLREGFHTPWRASRAVRDALVGGGAGLIVEVDVVHLLCDIHKDVVAQAVEMD